MSEIKRFNFVVTNYGEKSFSEHPYGNYCNYSDWEREHTAHNETKKKYKDSLVRLENVENLWFQIQDELKRETHKVLSLNIEIKNIQQELEDLQDALRKQEDFRLNLSTDLTMQDIELVIKNIETSRQRSKQ